MGDAVSEAFRSIDCVQRPAILLVSALVIQLASAQSWRTFRILPGFAPDRFALTRAMAPRSRTREPSANLTELLLGRPPGTGPRP